MVLRYELVCGHILELIVPTGQLRADQVVGDITTWCPTCDREQDVIRVHLDAPADPRAAVLTR
jgi:hypothetical protein